MSGTNPGLPLLECPLMSDGHSMYEPNYEDKKPPRPGEENPVRVLFQIENANKMRFLCILTHGSGAIRGRFVTGMMDNPIPNLFTSDIVSIAPGNTIFRYEASPDMIRAQRLALGMESLAIRENRHLVFLLYCNKQVNDEPTKAKGDRGSTQTNAA